MLVRRWKPTNQSQPEMQVVLPAKHRNEVLYQLHNSPSGGHLGVAKTAAKVQQRYYWPWWIDDVKRHISQCEECSRRKGPKRLPIAPLTSIPIGNKKKKKRYDSNGCVWSFPDYRSGKQVHSCGCRLLFQIAGKLGHPGSGS